MEEIVFINVPGLHGSNEFHWQTKWEKSYSNFYRVEQSNWDVPQAPEWVDKLDLFLAQFLDKKIVLVAHSMGCITISNWAERFSRHIHAAILVAPADVSQLLESQLVFGFSKPSQNLPFPTVVVASENDQYASIETSKDYAQTWGSKFVSVGKKGHINALSNLGNWDEGYAILQNHLHQQEVMV